jgi:hypothetical protein
MSDLDDTANGSASIPSGTDDGQTVSAAELKLAGRRSSGSCRQECDLSALCLVFTMQRSSHLQVIEKQRHPLEATLTTGWPMPNYLAEDDPKRGIEE